MAILLILSGCRQDTQKKNPLHGHSGNYTTAALIHYKDMKAEAIISQETPSSCMVEFKSPQSVAGMAFVFGKDDVDVTYKGLSFTFARDSLPPGLAANLAVSAINKAMKDDGISIDFSDSVLEAKGMLESGEFCLRIDKDTGTFIKLLVPAEELEIEFDNFRFLD